MRMCAVIHIHFKAAGNHLISSSAEARLVQDDELEALEAIYAEVCIQLWLAGGVQCGPASSHTLSRPSRTLIDWQHGRPAAASRLRLNMCRR